MRRRLAIVAVFAAVLAQPSSGARFSAVWLESAFNCIHRHEGAWSANTGNGYYGGLQMNLGFQRTYGGAFLHAFGTADRWPVSVQMAVGIRAYLSRGFAPWPNTAKTCGLR